MKRKQRTNEEKRQLIAQAEAIIKEGKTREKAAKELGIHPTQIRQWTIKFQA